MDKRASKYTVAVILPVLNEEKFIGTTLEQIYNQEFPMDQVEVIIADGGSTDKTREIADSFKKRFGSLRVLDNPGQLSSCGRNVGVRHSTAPYILVVDGHCFIPSKTLLKDMVELFEKTDAECLCRAQPLNPPDLSEFEQTVAYCRGSFIGHNPASDIFSDREGPTDPTSSGAMYRREVFVRVGYFDEDFDACEDVEFNFRVNLAGLKAIISPKLRVRYYPRNTLTGLWKQMLRYGRGRFRFGKKHQQFSLFQTAAASGVVIMALLLLLAPFSQGAAHLFKNLLSLYALIVLGVSLFLAINKKHPGCLFYGILIFPIIHFGLGTGYLLSFIDNYLNRDK